MAGSPSHESFSELLKAELQVNPRASRKFSVPAGHVIFNEGDVGDGMYLVDQGRVEIYAAAIGHDRRILSHFDVGAFFGEMAVLEDLPRSATAAAEVESVLYFIPRDEALRLLETSPRLLFSLMQEFSTRMRNFTQHHLQEVLQAERLALVGRFARTIVHDFKNPLNTIGLAADLLGFEGTAPSDRSTASLLIRKQIDRLANMINELLDFSRDAPGAVCLVPTDYGEFVREVILDIQPEAAEKAVDLEFASPPPCVSVMLDRRRLLHVFYNLINNAIDFMPCGGKITLRFQLTEEAVTTEVEDTGPGIAPEIAACLFEPFATHGKPHGTGLGLSICKRIIEDHRGQLRAESAPERGAIFSFTLPCAK